MEEGGIGMGEKDRKKFKAAINRWENEGGNVRTSRRMDPTNPVAPGSADPTNPVASRWWEIHVDRLTHDMASGTLRLPKAHVRWMLSINADHVPDEQKAMGQRTYRSIRIEGQEVEFSEGFTDLHTDSYRDILSGGGFSLEDARTSIEIVHAIRG